MKKLLLFLIFNIVFIFHPSHQNHLINIGFIEYNNNHVEDLIVAQMPDDEFGNYIQIESIYNVELWNVQGKKELYFYRCKISGQLSLPSCVEKIILRESVIHGGINFENKKGIVYKNSNVRVGAIIGGVIE